MPKDIKKCVRSSPVRSLGIWPHNQRLLINEEPYYVASPVISFNMLFSCTMGILSRGLISCKKAGSCDGKAISIFRKRSSTRQIGEVIRQLNKVCQALRFMSGTRMPGRKPRNWCGVMCSACKGWTWDFFSTLRILEHCFVRYGARRLNQPMQQKAPLDMTDSTASCN